MYINKDGTAVWSLGSIVEVTLYGPNRDPNRYFARCLTGGTWPTVQVLDEKYPEPLTVTPQATPVIIWRQLPEEEAAVVCGEVVEEPVEEPVEEFVEEAEAPSPLLQPVGFGKPFTAF